jgi:hypothetical protein
VSSSSQREHAPRGAARHAKAIKRITLRENAKRAEDKGRGDIPASFLERPALDQPNFSFLLTDRPSGFHHTDPKS